MKTHRSFATWLATLALFASVSARADDTEIYFATGSETAAQPLVMFSIEYTPNLASTVCTGVAVDGSNLSTACPQASAVTHYFNTADFADTKIDLFEELRAVLKKTLAKIGNLRVGLMLFHNNNNNCDGPTKTGCSNGGYIYQGFLDVDTPPSTFDADNPNFALLDANKLAIFTKLDNITDPQGHVSHPNQNKELYFEFFRYLTGQGIYNGHNGWTDYGTSSSKNLGDPADGTTSLKWDTAIESSTTYISPLTDNCSRVFVVNIFDGGGNQQNDSDNAIKDTLANGGMALNLRNGDSGFVDEVRWLHDKDLADGTITGRKSDGTTGANLLQDNQNVTSFFIANQPQQVDAAAVAGGTARALSLSSDTSVLEDTLDQIFTQILSVSTTFVAASIPVNVFNRSEVLDNAYIALFQANGDAQPQWVGNVKKLKLSIYTVTNPDGTTENRLQLIDANNTTAVSPTDGRIMTDALTYWTDSSGYDLTDNIDTSIGEVSGRDGRSVNRGGAGQKIPNFLGTGGVEGTPTTTNGVGTRQLFTEPNSYSNGTPTALLALNADTSTASNLWSDIYSSNYNGNWNDAVDVASLTGTWASDSTRNFSASVTIGTEAVNLLKFIRGFDVNDEDGDGSTTDSRRWLFGDPLHSRPLPMNYGARTGYSDSNPDIRLLVGSNDGFLRMIRNTKTDGTEDGSEVWAFMPREALRIQKQLMDDNAGGSPVHPFAVDGAPSAYVYDANGNGTIDRIYVGDTGGVVWRADIIGNNRSTWKATALFSAGRHYSATDADDRRFFYPPDYVQSEDSAGKFDAVVIGSGNRAHPLDTSVSDWMYMIKDRTTSGALASGYTTLTPDDLYDVTDNCLQADPSSCGDTSSLDNGWKLQMTTSGEKILASALTLHGTIYFSSYVPTVGSSNTCAPSEGTGYLYAVSLENAGAVFNFDTTTSETSTEDRKRELASGGIPSENVYVSFRDGDGNTYTGVLSPDLEATQNLGTQAWQTYWYEKQE